jgi:hypothetical protein
MKIIVCSLYVFKYITEYLNTYDGYISTIYDKLFNYDLNNCDELVIVQLDIWKWLPDYIFKLPLKISIINTEQLTCDNHKNNLINNIIELEKKCEYKVIIYDYSKTNCRIIEENGFISCYHEYISTKEENDFLKSLCTGNYEYDVGFVGGLNDRRLFILNELKKLDIKVLICEDWGRERDINLAKCKYILNIHWNDEYKIFETIRCNRLLQAGIKIISEDSIDMYENPNLLKCVYDNLIKFTEDLIKNN